LIELPIVGALTGRTLAYYLVFVAALLLFLAALRIVNSPFGRVLQAIRENDFRAEALGYRTVGYRIAANCLAAAMAVLAGGLSALWLRYTGPDTTLSFAIMVDILLMVVIGGMGTMYGAVIGASLFVLVQNYLQKLMATAAQATEAVPVLAHLLHPDRWLLWLGILFVLSVYFFPAGIVGKLRQTRGLAPATRLALPFAPRHRSTARRAGRPGPDRRPIRRHLPVKARPPTARARLGRAGSVVRARRLMCGIVFRTGSVMMAP
jgi:branched-chain amino acid transport system permease protein